MPPASRPAAPSCADRVLASGRPDVDGALAAEVSPSMAAG